MSDLPRQCYWIPVDSFVEGQGFRASIVIEGEPGHYPTGDWPYDGSPGQRQPYFWGQTYDEAKTIADEQNEKLGISKRDALEIVASTMGLGKRRGRHRQ
jgi:hypothetical protein